MHKRRILVVATTPNYPFKGSFQRTSATLRNLSSEYVLDFVNYPHGTPPRFTNLTFYGTSQHFQPSLGVGKPSFGKLSLDVLVFLKAFDLLRKHSYEAIHCEDFEAAFIGFILQQFFPTPLVYNFQNGIVDNLNRTGKHGFLSGLLGSIEEKIISRARLIVYNWQIYSTKRSFQGKPHFLFYDRSDTSLDIVSEDFGDYMYYGGNFESYQGVIPFLEVYRKSMCSYKVLLVGPPNRAITAYLAQHDFKGRVVLYGPSSAAQGNYFAHNAKVCILPRLLNGAGSMKLLQYFGWGTPVIATNKNSNRELVSHGENGFLYDTEEELLDILKKVEQPKILKELETGAQKTKQLLEEIWDEKRFITEYEKAFS